MDDVKQVVVVRKDLHMRKDDVAAQVAQASMKFIIDNNEAERGDELTVKLSPAEVEWLMSGSLATVVGCDSEEALLDLVFRAELADIEVHSVRGLSSQGEALTCAAFGPCTSHEIDRIMGSYKAT